MLLPKQLSIPWALGFQKYCFIVTRKGSFPVREVASQLRLSVDSVIDLIDKEKMQATNVSTGKLAVFASGKNGLTHSSKRAGSVTTLI
ncbi:MAG TPA: hypothetical protein VM260_24410 [Pirellula sp.]|nr:hypothetical protein [Pirellula sp.]